LIAASENIESTINFSLKDWPQHSFKPVFNSHVRYLIIYGSAGAGKSYSVAQKLIYRCWLYPNNRVIAIRKYGPSLRITSFKLFCDLIAEKHMPCNINKTDMSIHFPNGSSIQCISIVNTATGEPGERLKSLTDVTDMWIEEPTEIRQAEFEMIRLRLRGHELKGNYRQLILTFNPIDQNHWLNQYFFIQRNEREDVEIQHYTYKDNHFLDEDYVKSLEELIDVDANLHKIYTLGEWGSLENQVYTNWEQDLFGYQYEDFDATIAGVDFGWENPNAFILLGIKERNIFVIDELYMRGALNSEFIEKIQEKLKEHIPDTRLHRQIPMYCDSAEPSKIAEMKAADLNVHPAKKDVLDGISAVRQHKLIINPRAVQTLKEIHGYSRQKDKDGNIQELPDKRKGFDHLMDAMRYAVYTWTLKQRKGGRVIMPQIVGEGGGRWGGLR